MVNISNILSLYRFLSHPAPCDRRLILCLFILDIFLSPFLSYATGNYIELKPKQIKPGAAFMVRIRTDSNVRGEIRFNGSRYMLYREGDLLLSLIPSPIDMKPGTYPVSINLGKKEYTLSVRVIPYKFRTIELTLPESKVTLSPEDQKRVEREFILQRKIWEKFSARQWNGSFILPLDTEISTEFGVKRILNGKKISIHRGIDLKGKEGTPVRAINSGRAVLCRDLFYGGNTIIIDHGTGLYSIYMHLSGFNIKEGDTVKKGQIIGFVGKTGRVTGPHLHLSVKLNGMSINPLSLIDLIPEDQTI
jgi:hemin uptake protein HemP